MKPAFIVYIVLLFICASGFGQESYRGGIEALVFSDGAVTLPARKFRELVKTYKGRTSLTFKGSGDGLCTENFVMPVLGYDPSPKPPAAFQVFPARSTTTTLSGPSRIQ
jgi:hypothetical protein